MDDQQKSPVERRELLKNAGTVAFASITTSQVALAKQKGEDRDRYPSVENPLPDSSVADLALESVPHPNQERIAFITTALNGKFELCVAPDVDSSDKVPEEIVIISDQISIGVFDLEWTSDHRLKYWKDMAVYSRRVPPSYVAFEPTMERTMFEEGR